jgi:hypothetical protein
MFVAIDWDHHTQAEFDRIVEALIRRLYDGPGVDVVAYDGRGGDGGRDVVVRIGRRVLLFQLKYFRDGFSDANRKRRRQIRTSFDTAIRGFKPTAWFLVIPTRPTPGEEDFVNGLARTSAGLKVKIRGRDFLDERLAANPDIEAYFLRDWLREAAKDYGRERAVLLAGLPDLTERHQNLGGIASSLDLNWGVETAYRAGVVEHTLYPKHSNAAQESPITFTVSTAFGPEHAGLEAALRRVLGFGTRESVTLPPETVRTLTVNGPSWLSIPDAGVELTWRPADTPPDAPKTAELDIVDLDNVVLSSHYGTVAYAGSGALGYSIEMDLNDAARVELLISREGTVHLSGKLPFTDVTPAVAKANIRLFRDLLYGNGVELRLDSLPIGRCTRAERGELDEQTATDLAIRELLVDDLEIVQDHCRSFFPVPAELSLGDRIEIRLARLLAEGHCVISRTAQTWSAVLNGQTSAVFEQLLSSDTPQALTIGGQLAIQVLGRTLRMGEARFFHTQVEVLDRTDHMTPLRAGRGANRRIVFAPTDNMHYRVYLPAKWNDREDQPLVPSPWGLHGLDGPTLSESPGVA